MVMENTTESALGLTVRKHLNRRKTSFRLGVRLRDNTDTNWVENERSKDIDWMRF